MASYVKLQYSFHISSLKNYLYSSQNNLYTITHGIQNRST